MALADDILVVGVPGLEAVLVFHRVWVTTDGRFDWVKDPAVMVKSPDWDKDVVLGVSKVHYQVHLILGGRTGRATCIVICTNYF